MTLRPCDQWLLCDCTDDPIKNFSSETPDPNTFFRLRFPHPIPPPIDMPPRWYTKESCLGVCESTISQEDADACALRDAQMCELPPLPPQPGDPVLFGNEATSCQYDCPEGPPFVLSIPAGTYLALSQQLANLTAQSFCANLVFENHTCEMPGPPPVPGNPCVRITGTSPPSPVNLMVGDDVTLSATFSYAGNPNSLMFVWYLNATPIAFTMNASLTLDDVMESEQGPYTLGIFAPGCTAVFSGQIQVNVSNCPAEMGDPAPDTLDIAHPVEWETWTIDTGDFGVLVSSNAFCNPTQLFTYTSPTGLDHAPGIYGEKYVSGFVSTEAYFPTCPPLTPFRGAFVIFSLVNEKYNFDSPVACNDLKLNNGTARDLPGDPPPTGSYGGGALSACHGSIAGVQAELSAFWSGKVIAPNPYPPNGLNQFPHENDGGMFSVYWNDDPSFPPVMETPLVFKMLQIAGNIPQPRKLLIDNFAANAAMFSNPALAANWAGDFNTRDAYTSSDLRWEAPAIGAFGGARVSYITNHPTSTNGKGWKLEIYGAGPSIVWRGYKAIGQYSIGLYYKDSATTPVGPSCLNCSDNSDVDWFPPP
jgi:hypothetical protein